MFNIIAWTQVRPMRSPPITYTPGVKLGYWKIVGFPGWDGDYVDYIAFM